MQVESSFRRRQEHDDQIILLDRSYDPHATLDIDLFARARVGDMDSRRCVREE